MGRKTEWAQIQRFHINAKSAHKQSWQRHRRKQSWHKYRADKDVSGCKHREWENNMRRSGTKEKIRHQRELLQQQQKRQATKSDRQHTRLHQRKYDLTFLKCLQSGIIRGTRSMHKLAEWSNSVKLAWVCPRTNVIDGPFQSADKCFLWEDLNKKPFQRTRLKNLIGGIILIEFNFPPIRFRRQK